jgi:hypothetical protein
VWDDRRYNQVDVFYMLSTNNGLSWEEEQRIEDDPGMSLTPDLAISGSNVHVVWDDRRPNDPGRGIYYSRLDVEVGIEDETERLPSEINLTAYPNPFNGNTVITYNLEKGGEIEIYNITGRKIRTLIAAAKEGKTKWDARDALGNKVSSGIYFARAGAPQNSNTIKLVYVK